MDGFIYFMRFLLAFLTLIQFCNGTSLVEPSDKVIEFKLNLKDEIVDLFLGNEEREQYSEENYLTETKNVLSNIGFQNETKTSKPKDSKTMHHHSLKANISGTHVSTFWWPDGLVPFVIDSSIPNEMRSVIKSAMQQVEDDVTSKSSSPCVRFIERTGKHKSYLRIFHGSGCQSVIGYQNIPGQNMSLGEGCMTKGIVMHELMHVLGFYHEQNRPDRDMYIDIDYTNLAKSSFVDFQKFSKTAGDSFGLAYDYGSITHYGPYYKALHPNRPVITPKRPLKNKDIVMGQRDSLSIYDVIKIQKAYSCDIDITKIIFPKTNKFIVNCHFSEGICNLKQGPKSGLDWNLAKGTVKNGPVAGHSTGTDTYLVVGEESDNARKTARITTPLSTGGPFCLDFYLFQKGPSSYLDVVASGPRIRYPVTVRSFKGDNKNAWKRVWIVVNAGPKIKALITLKARMSSGAIAIDDFKMYSGKCGR